MTRSLLPPDHILDPADARARAIARTGAWPLIVAVMLVAAPNLVFLATHLASPVLAGVCVACATLAVAFVARDIARVPAALDRAVLLACLAAALAICLLGGEAHVFFSNDDWLIRDAVLGDLVAHPWPVGYIYGGDQTILRAPLGLYLLPALVGKALGLRAAHVALLAQDTVLFGSILYCFVAAAAPRRRALWIVAVFVVYSGWDVVGQLLLGKSVAFATHLPRWAGGLQFSSDLTQMFWAPNHALSGWMFVAAYLAWRRGRLGAPSLLVVFGLCVFWSPLSMIGALPFAARAALADLWGRRLSWPGLAAVALAALALAPIAVYLIADSGRVAHGGQALSADFVLAYAIFLGVEILPYALIVLLLYPRGDGSPWRLDIAIAFAILLVAPLFRIGGADFVMRATIPALAMLALRVADTAWPAEGRATRGAMFAAVVALMVGFVSPFYEIERAVTSPAFAISDCNMMTAARFPPNNNPMFHYLARVDVIERLHGLLRAPRSMLSADEGRAACWPDDTGFRG